MILSNDEFSIEINSVNLDSITDDTDVYIARQVKYSRSPNATIAKEMIYKDISALIQKELQVLFTETQNKMRVIATNLGI